MDGIGREDCRARWGGVKLGGNEQDGGEADAVGGECVLEWVALTGGAGESDRVTAIYQYFMEYLKDQCYDSSD